MRTCIAACALAALLIECASAQTPAPVEEKVEEKSPPEAATTAAPSASPTEAPAAPITQGGGFGVKTSLRFLGSVQAPHNRTVCMLHGMPPEEVRFERIATIKANKGTYGRVDEVLQEMADQARRFGADAVVALSSRQHINVFLPWRYSRPIGEGMLIHLNGDSPKLDCEKSGGRLF